MKRYLVLYIATLIIMVPLDILFLGFIAKGFFQSHVGDMLGELKPLPGLLFYLIYAVGIVVFVVSGAASPRQTLLLGALFGFVAYSTFDLTALATLRHWSWTAGTVDMAWGAFVTAISATGALLVATALGAEG